MARKLLIVDDIRINREILKNMLDDEYEFIEASNGEEALSIMERDFKKISAVILDLGMPVMDGFEVLSHMQKNKTLSQLPVIVATGQTDSDSEEKALKLGAKDYIQKPYKSAIIKQRIRNTINLRETSATVNALQRDRLTGLYNREAFFERVAEMLPQKEPGYYIMSCFDIDKFKIINDQYGTQRGDEVLKYIAGVFNRGFESIGGICCRIASDNFAVFYPAFFGDSKEIAKIREEAAMVDGIVAPIVFSIGRYIVTDFSISPSAMYDRAVLAVESIKGRYDLKIAVYDESMRAHLLKEQEIVTDMETALKTRQFETWFQPQYNHSSGALIGSEALVRWRHPEKGMISPGEFVPVFEQNGFIYELDKYIWEEVCKYLQGELEAGNSPLPVSVNVSRYDVFLPDIIDSITGLVKKYGIPVDLLRLEITESAFTESTTHIVKVVKELINLGFTIEIDDFGSGYSSLNTLKNVPAQVVKLDMRFLEDDGDSERGGNIIESIVRMTKWLGMSVIAEGVEKIEQANYLRSIGCNYIQGYLYAKPMPLEDYRELCKNAEKEEKLLTMETVENLDNNSFWNPESMDTLIFNSYVGGACIFEYHKGKIELLRASEKYAQVMGSAGMDVETALGLNWNEYLDEESLEKVARDVQLSIETKNEVTDEYVFLDLPDCPHETYLRSSIRVIARAGMRYLIYCMNENITAQRQAEKREHELTEKLSIVLNNISGAVTATLFDEAGVHFLMTNNRYYEQLGYTKEQYEKEVTNVFGPLYPEDAQNVISETDKVNADGKPRTVRYRVICRDKSIRWLQSSISTSSFPGIEGTIQLSIATDITEQIETEQKIRSMSDQMQMIMSSVDIGITAMLWGKEEPSFLFVNNKYYEMLGYTKEQYREEVKNILSPIIPEDRERVFAEASRVSETGESALLEYSVVCRDKSRRVLRTLVSMGKISGVEEPVQLSVFRDITNEKETKQRERRLFEQMQAIMNDMISGVTATIFRGGKAEILFSNEKYYRMHGYTREQYEQEVLDADLLIYPEDRERVVEFTKEALIDDTPARLEYRVVCRDKSVRWIRAGISNTRFTGIEQNVRLCIFTDITAIKEAEQELLNTAEQMKTLMDDTPGGFVRMRIHPDGNIRPVYINEGMLKLIGMSYSETMELYGKDAKSGVHPDDVKIVNDAVASMLKNGEAHSSRYRLLRGDGTYLWTSIFGRVTKDKKGDSFLNIYYTDATEQVKKEEQQKELLDNLPYGAALYEYDGKNLLPVHLNSRYWELVGRSDADYSEEHFLDAVHSGDRKIISEELALAISGKRDITCDVRILCEEGKYRPFHIVGRVVPKESGKYSIYASFTPISADALSIQEMLPIALQAMMMTQSGFSFVKDKNLNYVCCSREVFESAGFNSEAEIVGKSDFDIYEKKVAEKFREADVKVMETGESAIDRVYHYVYADGKDHYSSTSKYPLKDTGGNIIGIYGVGRDITEARAMESRLELLTNSVPGGIAIYEGFPDALDKISLAYFSDGFCRLFGYSREEYEKLSKKNPLGLVFTDDLPKMLSQVRELVTNKTPLDLVYRAKTADGSPKWINVKAVMGEPNGEKITVNAVLFDVTERQEALEHLRISEEENRLAIQHSGNAVCRFDVAARELIIPESSSKRFDLPQTIKNIPEEPIERGEVSLETADAYREFFEGIINGNPSGYTTYQRRSAKGWRWLEARHTTIFGDDGKPVSAVVTFKDVTEQSEKEVAYKKWQQSFRDRKPEVYSLYCCNVGKRTVIEAEEGSLLNVHFGSEEFDFDKRAEEYASEYVLYDDRARFMDFLNVDLLLAGFYQGRRTVRLEYREKVSEGGGRWLRLSVDLVEHPHSSEVEAYLLFENIDEAKRAELTTREMAETDPLTGVMNRVTFASRVNDIIKNEKPDSTHAMMMLDLDGFKHVNDSFGHGAGDEALIEIADSVRTVLRKDDLIGRLGGDEFLVFLTDIPGDSVAANKAQQICALCRKSFSVEVEVSGSIGIVIAPRDGTDFSSLYKKVDAAMYHVKGSGKDSYAFYHEDMANEHLKLKRESTENGKLKKDRKRRILIVDDSRIDNAILSNIFEEDFIIEKAKDGNSALIRLRHYGSAISAVLLDLLMPGMNGFAVLRKMQESSELRNIPVIVVSGDENRETSLQAIRAGAVDYVSKPVDPDILRIRVQSAISKAENERLRAKNSFLEFQNSEVVRYKTVLERSGTVVMEYDWINNSFTYDPAMSSYIAGTYDDRKLWYILLADMVTDTMTVKKIQEFVHSVAADRQKLNECILVQLKTPSGALHWFKMSVYKIANDLGLTHRLYMTFNDIGASKTELGEEIAEEEE